MSVIERPQPGHQHIASDAPSQAVVHVCAIHVCTIHVCTSCRQAGEPESAERPGARLLADLLRQAEAGSDAIEIVAVECLSVCKRPCTVAFSSPGKWTYVYGDLPPDTSAETILAGAALYGDAADGIIPWRQRPDALKKGVVARIPPLRLRSGREGDR